MALHYEDPIVGGPVKVKSRDDGDAIVPVHDIDRLPGTVQTDIAASKAKLDAISAAQAAPGAIYGDKTVVATAGSRVPLGASQPLTEGVELRGLDENTQLVYVGGALVSATGKGTRLAANERLFVRCNNVALVYLDADISGEGVTWIAW